MLVTSLTFFIRSYSVKCQLTTIVATAAVSTPIVNSKPTIGSDAGEKGLPSIAVTATIKTVTTKK